MRKVLIAVAVFLILGAAGIAYYAFIALPKSITAEIEAALADLPPAFTITYDAIEVDVLASAATVSNLKITHQDGGETLSVEALSASGAFQPGIVPPLTASGIAVSLNQGTITAAADQIRLEGLSETSIGAVAAYTQGIAEQLDWNALAFDLFELSNASFGGDHGEGRLAHLSIAEVREGKVGRIELSDTHLADRGESLSIGDIKATDLAMVDLSQSPRDLQMVLKPVEGARMQGTDIEVVLPDGRFALGSAEFHLQELDESSDQFPIVKRFSSKVEGLSIPFFALRRHAPALQILSNLVDAFVIDSTVVGSQDPEASTVSSDVKLTLRDLVGLDIALEAENVAPEAMLNIAMGPRAPDLAIPTEDLFAIAIKNGTLRIADHDLISSGLQGLAGMLGTSKDQLIAQFRFQAQMVAARQTTEAPAELVDQLSVFLGDSLGKTLTLNIAPDAPVSLEQVAPISLSSLAPLIEQLGVTAQITETE